MVKMGAIQRHKSAFEKVSDDILLEILKLIPLNDQLNLLQTCSRMYNFSLVRALWKNRYLNDFHTAGQLSTNLDWYKLYKHRIDNWFEYTPVCDVFIGKNKCVNDTDLSVLSDNSCVVITAGGDGSLRSWSSNSTNLQPETYMPCHRDSILCCVFTSNYNVLIGSKSGMVRKVCINNLNRPVFETKVFKSTKEKVEMLTEFSQGVIAIGSGGSLCFILNCGEVRELLRAHSQRIVGIHFFEHANKLISLSYDGIIKIWEWRTAEKRVACLAAYHVNCNTVSGMCVYKDYVVIGGYFDGSVHIYDLKSEERVAKLRGHCAPVTALSEHEGYLVSGSNDGSLCLWALENNKLLRTFETNEKITQVKIKKRKVAYLVGPECHLLKFA